MARRADADRVECERQGAVDGDQVERRAGGRRGVDGTRREGFLLLAVILSSLAGVLLGLPGAGDLWRQLLPLAVLLLGVAWIRVEREVAL